METEQIETTKGPSSHPSKQKEYVAKYFREYYNKYTNQTIHCDSCRKDIKKLQFSKHTQGKFHKLLEQVKN
jgi:hypothetical protein